HEIGPEGRDVAVTFEPAWFREAMAGVDAELAPSGAGAQVTISRLGQNFLVRGAMSGHISVPCARCLNPAAGDVGGPIHSAYTREPAELDAEIALGADIDVDFASITGDEIDLGALFREQLLLTIPMVPLCREECRGLCPRCGTDLNQGDCTC